MNKYDMEKRKAYSYTRISTPDQRKGAGLQRQIQAAENYCLEHNLDLDSTLRLSDEGVSAFHGDNVTSGKLGQFLSMVDSGKISRNSILIVESLDRVSRQNAVQALELFLSIIRKGISIVTLLDNAIYNQESLANNTMLLFSSIMVLIRAHEESVTKSKRIKDSRNRRRENANKGIKYKVYTPPWCSWNNGDYLLDKTRADVIKKIFQMYLDGKGVYIIAKELNKQGIHNFSRGYTFVYTNAQKKWYTRIIAQILTDKRLIGVDPKNEASKNDYFPRVIDDDLFNQVQYRITSKKKPSGKQGSYKLNLFTGLIKCGLCGTNYQMFQVYNSDKYRYLYLICEKAKTGNGCSWKMTDYDTFEKTFVYLMSVCPSLNNLLSSNDDSIEKDIEILKGEIETKQQKINQIMDLILNSSNPPKTVIDTISNLERDIVLLKRKLEIANGKLVEKKEDVFNSDFLRNMPLKLQDIDYRYKVREAIRSVIKSVTVHHGNIVLTKARKKDYAGGINKGEIYPHYHVEKTDGTILTMVLVNVGKGEDFYSFDDEWSDKKNKYFDVQIYEGLLIPTYENVLDWNKTHKCLFPVFEDGF